MSSPTCPSRVVRSAAEQEAFEAGIVADLHAALGRHPHDEPLLTLIEELRAASPRFAALWERRPVAQHDTSRKTFAHPELGEITVDCDVLSVAGSDLRLIVYSAAPGSRDAQAIALLGALGQQSFADAASGP